MQSSPAWSHWVDAGLWNSLKSVLTPWFTHNRSFSSGVRAFHWMVCHVAKEDVTQLLHSFKHFGEVRTPRMTLRLSGRDAQSVRHLQLCTTSLFHPCNFGLSRCHSCPCSPRLFADARGCKYSVSHCLTMELLKQSYVWAGYKSVNTWKLDLNTNLSTGKRNDLSIKGSAWCLPPSPEEEHRCGWQCLFSSVKC